MIGAAERGLLAGLVGVAAMTGVEKVEQVLTGRADAFVPAHALERLLVGNGPGAASLPARSARPGLPPCPGSSARR
jgi:hypothetical protein